MHTLRKHTLVLAAFTERKKGTLLFKGKSESPVLRNTREEKESSFTAEDHMIMRSEAEERQWE